MVFLIAVWTGGIRWPWVAKWQNSKISDWQYYRGPRHCQHGGTEGGEEGLLGRAHCREALMVLACSIHRPLVEPTLAGTGWRWLAQRRCVGRGRGFGVLAKVREARGPWPPPRKDAVVPIALLHVPPLASHILLPHGCAMALTSPTSPFPCPHGGNRRRTHACHIAPPPRLHLLPGSLLSPPP